MKHVRFDPDLCDLEFNAVDEISSLISSRYAKDIADVLHEAMQDDDT